jgi:hypothetical protein
MVLGLFESAEQRRKDLREIEMIHMKYGDTIIAVLEGRAKDPALTSRERRHWARLLTKARRQYKN